MKFQEGEYNKVFLLILDNGAEIIARIPNPNAGPSHYTTASEVATMDFVSRWSHYALYLADESSFGTS